MKSNDWWLGYLLGVIEGISNRKDTVESVRMLCNDTIKKFEEEFKS